MPNGIIFWFVLGKPPEENRVIMVTGVKTEEASSAEEAVKRVVRDLGEGLNGWLLAAVPFQSERVDLLRDDLIETFAGFGVPAEKTEKMVIMFARKCLDLFEISKQAREMEKIRDRHLYN